MTEVLAEAVPAASSSTGMSFMPVILALAGDLASTASPMQGPDQPGTHQHNAVIPGNTRLDLEQESWLDSPRGGLAGPRLVVFTRESTDNLFWKY